MKIQGTGRYRAAVHLGTRPGRSVITHFQVLRGSHPVEEYENDISGLPAALRSPGRRRMTCGKVKQDGSARRLIHLGLRFHDLFHTGCQGDRGRNQHNQILFHDLSSHYQFTSLLNGLKAGDPSVPVSLTQVTPACTTSNTSIEGASYICRSVGLIQQVFRL